MGRNQHSFGCILQKQLKQIVAIDAQYWTSIRTDIHSQVFERRAEPVGIFQ
ncbi:hypothetical protein [Hydrogenispora ethanolica]|uniref:hypothetical protein n=1 Tax=Hydrogenispora ethanolica TaxID=1082276 RepID=UPI00140453E3|nr:hypothetical protein [Hydrogenispora ethanolica]